MVTEVYTSILWYRQPYDIPACSEDCELIHTYGFSLIYFVKYLMKLSDDEVHLNDI
jgi:hypothetical protein